MDGPRTRRDFLRLAAAAAAVAAGASCGSDKLKGRGAAKDSGERTLRIAQWSHFVPAYDRWFDDEYTKRWGEAHGIRVVVDHIAVTQMQARADAEAAAGSGHDIFGFVTPPPGLDDQVIDLREIVEKVESTLGKMPPFLERSVLNPRTGKYFAFVDYWLPNLVQYRADLWGQVEPGRKPDTWDDILRAAPKLKAMGHPVGIGISDDLDYSYSLLSLMHAYGSSIQDEDGNVTINSAATVEAVKMGVALFRSGMTDDVLTWDAASDNRFLASGKGSLILDPISAIRAIEQQDSELARQIALAPLPAGPAGRLGPDPIVGYVIWKFSRNQDLAKQFLVDLALNNRETFVRSEYYSFPAFPGAVPELAELLTNDVRAQPPGKYALLADAPQWMTNLGHPGYTNAAVEEIFNQFLVPRMFAAAVRGEMTPEESVTAAEAKIKPIFDKWREQGKI
ncbi:MAG: ABC transporter substrate-binding protein [Acidimicrobiia bacterium]